MNAPRDDRITRHGFVPRLLHWLSALSVLVLMGTGFLPIVGIKFEWVTVHWIAGIVLLLLVIVHVVRSLKDLGAIWFGVEDVELVLAQIRRAPDKPGKFSPAQKLMHLGVTVMVLATLVTGLVMMVKVDTPFWERNPYLLDDGTWGVIYVIHGLAALMLLTTIMLHIYFALRPEKLHYTRSMIRGWLTRGEYEAEHDTEKWRVEP